MNEATKDLLDKLQRLRAHAVNDEAAARNDPEDYRYFGDMIEALDKAIKALAD